MNYWADANVPPFGLLWRYGGWLPWLALALGLSGALLLAWHPVISLIPLTPLAALLYFFRCPWRMSLDDAKLIAPADGIVDDLEPVAQCPAVGGPAMRIGIFLSVFDVHVTRAPVTGQIKEKKFIPGRFGNAMSKGAGRENQRNEILFATESGHCVFMRQISGAIARRVVFEPAPGDTVRAGAVVGMIRFGSRIELFVPRDAGYKIMVRKGKRVRCGETVIGRPQKVEQAFLKEQSLA